MQNSLITMRGISSTLTFAFLFVVSIAYAQPSSDLSSAKARKCYAICLIQDQYETVNEQVLKAKATTKLVVKSAKYKTLTEQVLSKILTIQSK